MSDIRIRPINHADAEFIFELLNTEGWLKYIGDRGVKTVDLAIPYIEKIQQSYVDIGHGLMVVEWNDVPIGLCGLLKRDYLEAPDLGFAFLPAYQGKGLAFKAAKIILANTSTYGYSEIYAITLSVNAASIALLKKLDSLYARQVSPPDGSEVLDLYVLKLRI